MVKGKGKSLSRQEQKIRPKPWPIVTSDVCEKCPIQCPAGIAYMQKMNSGKVIGRGVTCKKDLFLKRKAEGLPPFFEILRLATPKLEEELNKKSIEIPV